MNNNADWKDKVILLTGGTGSFGQKFVQIMLDKYKPKVIRILSRDELKQWDMIQKFDNHPSLRFFLGDIRDYKRLRRAAEGADIIVHAAALKQVPLCEYNPFEAVRTNILGAENIINAAIDCNIEKVIAISTDKAVAPVNLYGATKMCMEKLIVAANTYVGSGRDTKMSCVRYGNVFGSRGSVVELFKKQKAGGKITVTDKEMTRFWITIDRGAEFVVNCTQVMRGGEIFIPKIPSMKVVDLAGAITPECRIEIIGIRPGEKIHECLLTEDEARHGKDAGDYFIIEPQNPLWDYKSWSEDKDLPKGFKYTSDSNDTWLSVKELKDMFETHER
ncbi:UDP-N-acetylglucosamine 4,6-dehydratase (inverting) [Elusimicrobiota bacterium]